MKLYPMHEVKTVNPYYTSFRVLTLLGFWDVSPICETQKNFKGYDWEITPTQAGHFRNKLGSVAIDLVLKNNEEINAIPVFKGFDPNFFFDKEIDAPVNRPWILFFMGNDDHSYGMRFSTETELNDFLGLGPDVGELELAWKN